MSDPEATSPSSDVSISKDVHDESSFESDSESSLDWEADNDPRALGLLPDHHLYYDDPRSNYNQLFNSVCVGGSAGNALAEPSHGSTTASSTQRADPSHAEPARTSMKRRRSDSGTEGIRAIRRAFEERIPQMSMEEIIAFQADFARKRMRISDAELAVMLQMSNNGWLSQVDRRAIWAERRTDLPDKREDEFQSSDTSMASTSGSLFDLPD